MKISKTHGALLIASAGFSAFLAHTTTLHAAAKLDDPKNTFLTALDVISESYIPEDIEFVLGEVRKTATILGMYGDDIVLTKIYLIEKQAQMSPADAKKQYKPFHVVLQAKLQLFIDADSIERRQVSTILGLLDIIVIPADQILETRSLAQKVLDLHGLTERKWAIGYMYGLSQRLSSTAEDGDVTEVPVSDDGKADVETVVAGAANGVDSDNQRVTG